MKEKPIKKEVINKRLQQIKDAGINIKSWKINNSGWDHLIIIVNHKWVFKFPREKDGIPYLRREANFLKNFVKISPIRVPNPEIIEKDFIGYKMIKGEEFTEKIFNNLNKKTKMKVARQYAKFLKTLHSCPIKWVDHSYVEWVNHRKIFNKYWNKIQKDILLFVSDKAKKNIIKFFNNFKKDQSNFKKGTSIGHMDLFYKNILWDKNKKEISGIIDFGDMGIGPGYMDFGIVDFSKPEYEDFLLMILNEYGKKDEKFIKQIKDQAKIAIFEYVRDDLEINNRGELKKHLKEVERIFAH